MDKRNRLTAATVVLLALLALATARPSVAADAPAAAPAPTASLAVSDKAPLGCCCLSTPDPGKGGCSYGLSEATCTNAAKAVATWKSRWTPGKCPTP